MGVEVKGQTVSSRVIRLVGSTFTYWVILLALSPREPSPSRTGSAGSTALQVQKPIVLLGICEE